MTLLDLESLRCFLAASQQLNFRQAARSVGLSAAAFGERIKRLEEQLGVDLFQRTTRRVTLTAAGSRLVPQAQSTLSEARLCQHVALHEQGPSPYVLTLGTRFELGMSWLTPALAELEQARQERQLHLFFGDTPALLDAIVRNRVDAAISSARITRGGLAFARLHEERYVFVAATQLVEDQPIEDASDVANHTLLELDASLPLFRYFLDACSAVQTWTFANTQYLGTIGPIRARCLEAAGVAVLPEYYVRRDIQAGKLRVLMPDITMASDWFRLIWRHGHPQEVAIQALAAELAERPLQ